MVFSADASAFVRQRYNFEILTAAGFGSGSTIPPFLSEHVQMCSGG